MAPLSPEELAASHEPGMSLPPGLGIGLGRTRIPFVVGVGGGGGDQHQIPFASNSNPPQHQHGFAPGGWSTSTSTTPNANGVSGASSGGRWITSVGAGGRVGSQAEEEDEMEGDPLFD